MAWNSWDGSWNEDNQQDSHDQSWWWDDDWNKDKSWWQEDGHDKSKAELGQERDGGGWGEAWSRWDDDGWWQEDSVKNKEPASRGRGRGNGRGGKGRGREHGRGRGRGRGRGGGRGGGRGRGGFGRGGRRKKKHQPGHRQDGAANTRDYKRWNSDHASLKVAEHLLEKQQDQIQELEGEVMSLEMMAELRAADLELEIRQQPEKSDAKLAALKAAWDRQSKEDLMGLASVRLKYEQEIKKRAVEETNFRADLHRLRINLDYEKLMREDDARKANLNLDLEKARDAIRM